MRVENTYVQQPVDDSHLSEKQKGDLKRVAKQFESIFTNQLVGAMRKTVMSQGLVPQSHGEKIYQSMLDQEYAGQMSETEQLGISKMVYEHLLRTMPGR